MKIFIKKLGCPKNDVDGDYIAAKLIESDHEIVNSDNEADVVIVNTCGFILPAKEESINEILFYEKLKQEGKIKKLIVTGCLSQRYSKDLAKDISDVDGIFGLGQMDQLVKVFSSKKSDLPIIQVKESDKLDYIAGHKRFIDSKYPYEYLKIAEGCNRFCAYCAIPYIRGKYRSRPIEDILAEAKTLADFGKKELILVSQEGTGYGRDFSDGTNIIQLLKRLEKIQNIEWIRLMYLHPESLTNELIEYMTSSEKVLGYFDVPLQHISDKILKMMNRKVTRSQIETKLRKIRDASPENIIRTTFITGFPGESDKEYDELHNFIEDYKFNRLGVFMYSPEEETKASEMDEQIPEKLAAERQDLLMSLQQEIAFEKNIALIDKFQMVIIDETKPDGPAVARTMGDCPDIDQTVFVKGDNLKVGDIIRTKIVMAEGYDLIAVTDEG